MNVINMIIDCTMKYLDPLGVIVGLVVAFPVFLTWHDLVYGRKKKEKKLASLARQSHGYNKTVLIIDLLHDKDVKPDVMRFIDSQVELKTIEKERIFSISRTDKLVPDDMPGFIRELREKVNRISAIFTDELYVFLAAPQCAAALLGAELGNSNFKVFLMQNSPNTTRYDNFGPLKYFGIES